MRTLLLACALAFASDEKIQLLPQDVRWADAPPALPAGTKVAVLEGTPKKAGTFTMRLKVPAGARIAPHWHPRPERVTVLSGSVLVGFGDTLDEKASKRFPAGSFYVNPPKVHHYVWADEEAVLQITGIGPWEIHYLKP